MKPVVRAWLLTGVVVLPWLFGGVYMWTRAWLAVALLPPIACAAFAFRSSAKSIRAARVPLALLAAGCALGFWQLTFAAADVDSRASAFRADFAASPSQPAERAPLSINPPATRRDLALLISVTAAFALGAVFFGEIKPLMSLMWALAVVGVAVAALGLVHRASSAPWNYAGTSAPTGSQPFGPFINRNNAAGFLGMCLAAAAGLLLWRSRKLLGLTRADRMRGLSTWPSFVLDPGLLTLGATFILLAAAVIATISRGGMLAAGLGTVVAIVIYAATTRAALLFWPVAAGGVAALSFVLWLGLGEGVFSRWMQLSEHGVQSDVRTELWSEALQACETYRLFGSGLGTFHYAIAPFQRHETMGIHRYAENQFIEALVVGGVVGLTLLCLLGLNCLAAVRKVLKNAVSSSEHAVAFGGISMLMIQAVYACFDFGWYLPSLSVPLAIWCGGLIRLRIDSDSWRSKLTRRSRSQKRATPPSTSDFAAPAGEIAPQSPPLQTVAMPGAASTGRDEGVLIGAIVGILLTAGLLWAFTQARTAAAVEHAEREIRSLFRPETEPADGAFDAALQLAREATETCPDSGDLRIRCAELLVKRYEMDSKQTVMQFYMTAALADRTGVSEEFDRLRNSRAAVDWLVPAWEQCRSARSLVPFDYFGQLLASQLCFVSEPFADSAFYLNRAERLAQGNSTRLFLLGAMQLDAARTDEAWRDWRGACELNPHWADEAFPVALSFLGAAETLARVLPDDPEVIVAQAQRNIAEFRREDRERYFRRALELTFEQRNPDARSDYVRGVALAELGDLEEAETMISRALRREQAHGDWYFYLAAIRAALGKTDAADVAYLRYQLLVGSGSRPIEQYRLLAARLLEQRSPRDVEQLRLCGTLYLRGGDGVQAVAAFRKATAAAPKDVQVLLLLAEALVKLGQLDDAERTARQAAAIEPDNLDVHALTQRIIELRKSAEP